MTRCERGSPCIYNSKFELVTKKNETILTCGQHLNYFLDKIFAKNPDEIVVIKSI